MNRETIVRALACEAGLSLEELEAIIREHDAAGLLPFNSLLEGMGSYTLEEIVETLVRGRFGADWLGSPTNSDRPALRRVARGE